MSILDFFKGKCSLLRQLDSLQVENLRLRKQLDLPTDGTAISLEDYSSARTHEEFAGALSLAVDSLQTQLSEMSNPVSDFGLREVSLQAKVMLEVTPLGILKYRFIKPGDLVDAQNASTISMTIIPVPKQDKVGTLAHGEFQRQVGVEEIPGITEDCNARLRQHGIYTTADFVQVGTRLRGAVRLAALLEVDRQRLNEWLARAQLLMLEGINSQTASLLFDAGIRGLNDLASLTPEQVISRCEKQNGTPVSAKHLALAQVERWIKSASAYTGDSLPEDLS
ncbi:MAG TPA: DUF4332 domain-containing protein [Pyrinomonadaceae bacterium]|jgi:hypothetical protein|nr:DUF4332 domain-containing protein [Pyrinomonadaceae bacterium]